MKARHSVSLLVIGFCLDFIGIPLKIIHHPYSDHVFMAASVFKVIGGLLFLYKLLNYPRFKDFMDS